MEKMKFLAIIVIIFGMYIPLSTPGSAVTNVVTWENVSWNTDYHSTSTISGGQTVFGRSDTLKFTKYANYHAQAKNVISIPAGAELIVEVDFYGDYVGSWSWAPVLKIINPNSGAYAYIQKEAGSYLRWGVNGYTSAETNGMMSNGRWYSMKIQARDIDSSSPELGLSIRDLTNGGPWIGLSGVGGGWQGLNVQGNLEIILGTDRLDDYSSTGGFETYYYDNIRVNGQPLNPSTPPPPVDKNVLVLVHGFSSDPSSMLNVDREIGSSYDEVYYIDLYSGYANSATQLTSYKRTGTVDQMESFFNGKNYNTLIRTATYLPVPIGPYTSNQVDIDLVEYASLSGWLYHTLLNDIQPNEGANNRLDIVAHSMGGLVTRSMVKYYAEGNTINGFTIGSIGTAGTPNHGTRVAKIVRMLVDSNYAIDSAMESLLDLTGLSLNNVVEDAFDAIYPGLGSEIVSLTSNNFLLGHLGQMVPGTTFLNNLNSGDETPFSINWVTLRGTENTDSSFSFGISAHINWRCRGWGWARVCYPTGGSVDIVLTGSLSITDLVWGQISWQSRTYSICGGGICINIPYGYPVYSELENDGVVDTSSVSLTGAFNYKDTSYSESLTHRETHDWNTFGTSLSSVITSWFNP